MLKIRISFVQIHDCTLQCKMWKMKYLFDARDVFRRWVVDDSKRVLQGDNEAFPVQNNNNKGEKFRSNLLTGGQGDYNY